jgi:hypothetical protein
MTRGAALKKELFTFLDSRGAIGKDRGFRVNCTGNLKSCSDGEESKD